MQPGSVVVCQLEETGLIGNLLSEVTLTQAAIDQSVRPPPDKGINDISNVLAHKTTNKCRETHVKNDCQSTLLHQILTL